MSTNPTQDILDYVLKTPANTNRYVLESVINMAESGKEDKSNKVTSIDDTSTDEQYPSAKCVYDALQEKNVSYSDEAFYQGSDEIVTISQIKSDLHLPDPMIFKGTVGQDGTISTLPEASLENVGFVYKVCSDGTYAGHAAKVGDSFISTGVLWEYLPSGDEPSGTVTNVATGEGLEGGPITSTGTISLSNTGVAAGTYGRVVVDAKGRVSAGDDKGQIYILNGNAGDIMTPGIWTADLDGLTAYHNGLTILFKPTGNAVTPGDPSKPTTTLNINNLGAKDIYIQQDITTNLTTNNAVISGAGYYLLRYDSNAWSCEFLLGLRNATYDELVSETVSTRNITSAFPLGTGAARKKFEEHDAAIEAKYTKPSTGIPGSDLDQTVQGSLAKAESALQVAPVTSVNGQTGDVSITIPSQLADLTSDSTHRTVNDTQINTWNSASQTVPTKYTKPSTGIPKSDLSSGVQESLDKADTALQIAPVTSVNGQTGDVSITIPSALADMTDDSTHRVVTDTQISSWNSREYASNKQTSMPVGGGSNDYYLSAPAVWTYVKNQRGKIKCVETDPSTGAEIVTNVDCTFKFVDGNPVIVVND